MLIYSLKIPNKIDELAHLTQSIEKILFENNISENDILNIILAMEELFVNQVKYGYSDNLIHIIDIELHLNKKDHEILIIIKNNGKEFNILNKPDPNIELSADERPVGGLGIYFIKQKMDFISYCRENDKNIITLKKIITLK